MTGGSTQYQRGHDYRLVVYFSSREDAQKTLEMMHALGMCDIEDAGFVADRDWRRKSPPKGTELLMLLALGAGAGIFLLDLILGWIA